ncbi:hypothetical protein RAS14_00510 [Achromobacter aegrifaciens]|uniref:hypothetical protein n=1 Tax=Achromobacter aegrifaciens TaxID=1287736 RepID=UPI00278E0E52|nr:hypothetical protein [Achromobacter aegrifaciens]MDQ1758211.1 hypothetical protein [Achromobacter aegrifaciens]
MIAATEYVFSVSWLPVVTGRTLNEAVAALQVKLGSLLQDQLNRGSEWAAALQRAIEDLRNSWEAADAYGDLDGKLPTLPARFNDLVASRQYVMDRAVVVKTPDMHLARPTARIFNMRSENWICIASLSSLP